MPILESALSLPSVPAPRRVILTAKDTVSMSVSPFTGAQQIQEWPGGDHWRIRYEMPPMKRDTAAEWIASLAELRGPSRRFMAGPTDAQAPQGAALGTPFVNAGALAGTYFLPTKGWTPSTSEVLMRGDYVQVENRLYMITSTEDADASGEATFDVWPSLRIAHGEDTPIKLTQPQGMFRLLQAERQLYDANEGKIYDISFDAIEAR